MMVKTIIYYAIGFIIMLGVALFDYRLLLKKWFIWFGITILLLMGVFFFGVKINGSLGWYKLPLGGMTFQPAELTKITLIFALAQWLGKRRGDALTFTKDLLPMGMLTFIPFLLVFIQPDLGNAIIYLVILLGMLWIGAIKYRHVLIVLFIMVSFVTSIYISFTVFNKPVKDFFFYKIEKKHWYDRINTYINPEEATDDNKYQSKYAKIAIGSGRLSGDGYMNGQLKQRKFISYAYSDAIFVVIGEEFGFQGSVILLLLYFLMLYRMIFIASQCYDFQGAYIIIGIVSMFVFQIFEHIGMMIGIMPITGITLPFISYGGTSLILNMISIGLVMSIRIYQEKYPLEP